MLVTKLRTALASILAVGSIAVAAVLANHDRASGEPTLAPPAEGGANPEGADLIPFQKIGLGADDLVEATGLDIYKFQVHLEKGQRFRVAFRVREGENSPARELIGIAFQKREEGPTTIRVSFLRQDRKLQGFLLSDEAQAEYRLDCSGCAPGGFATYVRNPLGDREPTRRGLYVHKSEDRDRRDGFRETRLITLFATDGGRPDLASYPRAELVIAKGH